jgi:pilus assembly protein Flp/PilA
MKPILMDFAADQSGTTVIEYGLLGALVSVACIGAMTAVGNTLLTIFTAISTAVTAAL